jgi:hypothetical protein
VGLHPRLRRLTALTGPSTRPSWLPSDRRLSAATRAQISCQVFSCRQICADSDSHPHPPDAEKIYSIFEPHTDLIKPGKMQTSLEFGHKVFLAESAKRLITQYEVLDGNPSDQRHVEPSLKRHKKTFGRA